MMSYVIILVNGIVLALVAIYVYENERRMGEITSNLDRTGHIRGKEDGIGFTTFGTYPSSCVPQIFHNDNVKDEFVAFTAITTNGKYIPDGPIIYDKVVTNIGKAYSSRFGIFRAPISGLYSFTFSLMGLHSDVVYMVMYKNNAEITRLYTRGGGTQEVASNTVYLTLEKGDEVYTIGTKGMKLYAAKPYNLFSGVLIKIGNF